MGNKAEMVQQLELLNDNLFHLMISVDALTDAIDSTPKKPVEPEQKPNFNPSDFISMGSKIASIINEASKK